MKQAYLFLLFLALIVSSCKGDEVTPSPSPTPPPPVSKTATAQILAAEVTSISLQELGIDPNSQIKRISDTSLTAKIVAGSLNVAAPSAPATDVVHQIELTESGGGSAIISLNLSALGSLTISEQRDRSTADDGTDLGPDTPFPDINVTGLTAENAFDDKDIMIRVVSSRSIDMSRSSVKINRSDFIGLDLSSFVRIDAISNTVTIPSSSISSAVPKLSGQYSIDISLHDSSFEDIGSYSIPISISDTRINGQLFSRSNQRISNSGGLRIGIVGFNNPIRRTIPLNNDGTFSTNDLPTGTYIASLLDLDFPNFSNVIFAIFPGDSVVDIVLVNGAPTLGQGASSVNPSSRTLPIVAAGTTGSSFRGNAPLPLRRPSSGGQRSLATITDCPATVDGVTTFSVASTAQGKSNPCLIDFAVARGTKNIEVSATVITAEFPEFTQQRSIFNDVWSYTISGFSGVPIRAFGSVNDTHFSMGTLQAEPRCIDVSRQTETGGFNISGIAEAVNVGDALLPTSVRISIKSSCDNKLAVESASFGNRNKVPYFVVALASGSQAGGNYVSIPTNVEESAWGIPFDINFSPKNAIISSIEIGIVSNGSIIEKRTVPFNQNDVTSPGVIRIRDFVFPQFSQINKNLVGIGLNLKISGMVEGVSMTSSNNTPNVSSSGSFMLTPLFLANSFSQLSPRRYGRQDGSGNRGGDSWARVKLTSWLIRNSQFRFDDCTALHAARLVTASRITGGFPSVLGHNGHSDGLQADLRYADGQGGFSDGLGGSTSPSGESGPQIRQLIVDARNEVLAQTLNGPRLALLRQYIADNRRLFERVASDPDVREIFIGSGFMAFAFEEGRFPSADGLSAGAAIPGVGTWTTKPGKLKALNADHRSHWHVSLFS
jgi:hypothetical protein